MAAKLNNRLNYAPAEIEEAMEGSAEEGGENAPSASDVIQKFEEELEINDFPQPVRWKITSRVSLYIFLFAIKQVLIICSCRKRWLRSVNLLRRVYLFAARTVRPERRLLTKKGSCIWLLKALVKWQFLKPARKSSEFSKKKCSDWLVLLLIKVQNPADTKFESTGFYCTYCLVFCKRKLFDNKNFNIVHFV